MKANEVKGIVHDLIYLRDWQNPMERFFIENRFKINLITGDYDYEGEEDSITELYKEKRDWFIDRVKDLNGDLKDFEKAEISVYGKKESVEIIYKGKKFEKDFVWEAPLGASARELKDKIKNLKPGEGFSLSDGKIVEE